MYAACIKILEFEGGAIGHPIPGYIMLVRTVYLVVAVLGWQIYLP